MTLKKVKLLKILPCLFCNSTDVELRTIKVRGKNNSPGGDSVCCNNCKAHGSICIDSNDAISWWNRPSFNDRIARVNRAAYLEKVCL